MRTKAKYIIAESYEEAAAKATEIFGCDQNDLFFETITEGTQEQPNWTLLAIPKEISRNLDGDFNLFYEEGGVFLEIYLPRGKGAERPSDYISQYLQRKGLVQMNALDVLTLLKKGYGRAKIAPEQQENILNEDIAVSIAKGDMEAQIKLLPPDEGGTTMTQELINEKLAAAGILYGIDDAVIEEMLDKRDYGRPYTVARGREVVDGENGALEFHFRRDLTRAPKDVGQGKVDLRTLDLFETVSEGQILVTRRLATPGEPGMSVKGKELAPKPGKEANMPRGKNVLINEDSTTMVAAAAGMVAFSSNTVTVTNVYQVIGDCDMGVGNINFDGSINILGNIISGMVIKATGNIVVGGVVEASELIAGGSIELKRGMQGMDKGKLTAQGDIIAQFIERATVTANGNVMADVIIHSTVDAGLSIVMSGKRASIMGGSIRATEEITAKTIGSISHAQTEIEVGVHPKTRERIKNLQDEVVKIKENMEKLEKLALYLSKSKNNMSDQERLAMRQNALEQAQEIAKLYAENTDELNRLNDASRNATHGRVHISDMVYPGVKIIISSETYRVDDNIQHATFRYSHGELTFVAYEGS